MTTIAIVMVTDIYHSGHLSVSEELVINTLVAFNNLSYHVESSDEFNTIEEDLTTGQPLSPPLLDYRERVCTVREPVYMYMYIGHPWPWDI